jgi:FixJ family two-component response regulator
MSVIGIVDDDASVRLATVDLMNSLGFCCDAYGSAEDYLASTRATRTSCLILDLNMPGLNGIELQQRLTESGRGVPTIIITAFPEEGTRARAIGGGALCYLPKPCRNEDLLECVRLALGGDNGLARGEDDGRSQ